MHLVIPYAAPLSDAGRRALDGLRLPALAGLLGRLVPGARNDGDEYQLSMPHERVLAQALGWAGADGALPWAARAAAADGIDTGDLAWGLLSPVHWAVGRDAITMGDPEALGLDAATSRAYFDLLRPLFETDGWLCAWGAPTRWYVAHESLDGLPTASLDRVVGRNPDLWLPAPVQARRIQRLSSELQMLLHDARLNAEREAAGLLPLNSAWLSGCGVRQPAQAPQPQLLDALRGPALREDWSAWCAAWQALDAGPLADALVRAGRGAPVALTLCGERSAQRWDAAASGWRTALGRLAGGWRRRPPLSALLAEL